MMKVFVKFGLASVLAVTLSTAAWAAGEMGSLTLVEAVTKGLAKNPEYGVVANNKLATREELAQARALYLPSIDFTAETGHERTDTPAINDKSLWHNRGALTLTQLLFDGMGTTAEIERQKHRVESASHRVGEVSEFVALDVVQGYLDVLRQRDLVIIARANVDDHTKILNVIQTGANAGTVNEGDVAQAHARVAQARATLASTEQDLRSAEALYQQKTGDMPLDLIFPDIPHDKLPATVDDAVREAVTASPTLAVFESDEKVAMAEYKASGSTLYPRIELQGNVTEGNDVGGLDGNSNTESVLAVMKWNLYRGGADKNRQREHLYTHAQAKERRAQAARQVEKDMRDTWAAMDAASIRAKQYLDQSAANEKVVSVYLDQFSLNRRTLLDVLDAQNELFVSRSSHISTLYAGIFAVYRVLALEGGLLSTLGVSRPREARIED